jgi:hypothetical protein
LPYDADIEHFCAPVIHSVTGETIPNYKKLAKDLITRETWTTSLGKEFGNITQGDHKTGEKGTNCVFAMTHGQIRSIPKDQIVTYAQIVIDFRLQKEDPNRVCITAGGNLIQYPCELTTRIASLTTSKILWNRVVSIEGAIFWNRCQEFLSQHPVGLVGIHENVFSYYPQTHKKTIQYGNQCPQ